ncbi:MAG: hypothetical protein QOH72_3525 [Solirubrobacteraceae bacterium]|nr:hypothetical protein [Solirubrobacteraceae bacterium]
MLPGVLLRPVLSLFDQGAAGFIVATSLFATAAGARWHHDDAGTAPTVRPRPSERARRHARAAACAEELDRPPWPGGRPRRTRPHRAHPRRACQRPAAPVVGATRLGEDRYAWTGRLIHAAQGAVVIDRQGGGLLKDELERGASEAGRTFRLSACPTAIRACPAVRVAELDARCATVSAQLGGMLDGTSAVADPESMLFSPTHRLTTPLGVGSRPLDVFRHVRATPC